MRGFRLPMLRKKMAVWWLFPGVTKKALNIAPIRKTSTHRVLYCPLIPEILFFLDNKVMHSSVPNRSREDYRWAYNFRYLPIGQPPGRPFIPGFVARSRSAPETELHNAYLWSAMWVRCLDYLTEKGAPTSYEGVSKMGLGRSTGDYQPLARTRTRCRWLVAPGKGLIWIK